MVGILGGGRMDQVERQRRAAGLDRLASQEEPGFRLLAAQSPETLVPLGHVGRSVRGQLGLADADRQRQNANHVRIGRLGPLAGRDGLGRESLRVAPGGQLLELGRILLGHPPAACRWSSARAGTATSQSTQKTARPRRTNQLAFRAACSRLREHVWCNSEHGHASEAMPPDRAREEAVLQRSFTIVDKRALFLVRYRPGGCGPLPRREGLPPFYHAAAGSADSRHLLAGEQIDDPLGAQRVVQADHARDVRR